MKLVIHNSPDLKFNFYIEKAVNYYAQELLPKRIIKNITIKINFIDDMKDEGSAGIEDYNTRKEPRVFSIEIYKFLSSSSIIKALAHEMCHVKQYINHEIDENLTSWKGNFFDSDTNDYWNHPWEIEAYGYETSLASKFVIKEKLWEIFSDFRDPSLPLEKNSIKWI